MRQLVEQIRLLSSFERKAFQNTKARLALAAIGLVPALYCLIFLSSVQDPYGNLSHLPAAIVNLDQGAIVDGQPRNIGSDLAGRLLKEKPAGFVRYATEESARKAVRSGDVFFSLTIPPDFSANAVRGKADVRAKLKFYASQGDNYFAFRVAESVANKIAVSVNESLALTRWERVGTALPAIKQGFSKLKEASSLLATGSRDLASGADTVASGMKELAGGIGTADAGSQSLASGAGEFSSAIDRLTSGMMALSDGIRTLDAAVPDKKDLEPFSLGIASLAENAVRLADGLEQLSDGAARAASGAAQGSAGSKLLSDSVKGSIFSPAELKTGTAKLTAGSEQLERGLNTLSAKLVEAAKGGGALSAGASRLEIGIGTLLSGIAKIKTALDTMAAALAKPDDLDKLAKGARQLAEHCKELSAGLSKLNAGSTELARGAGAVAAGASKLRDGIGELNDRIPGSIDMETGDPAGMAASVVVEKEITAPVADNATAFTPYFLAISLWLGCLVMTFVFPFLNIPETSRSCSQLARVTGKLLGPGILAAVQVMMVILCLALMGIKFDNPLGVLVTALLSSWTFLLIVFMFLTLLGDAGRLLCIILLVLQIGAAGGSFPVEVSPAFFRAVHGWLPVTYSVEGFRCSISRAYEGHFMVSLLAIVAFAVAAFVIMLFARKKWRNIRDDECRLVAEY
jgi:putative membrane protein